MSRQLARRKKAGIITSLVLIAAIISVFIWLPPLGEKRMNMVVSTPPYSVSVPALELHKSLLVADMHADSLLWDRDLLAKSDYGHVDIPRLIEGNVALQCFTVVTKSPSGLNVEQNQAEARDNITVLAVAELWPPNTWNSLKARALYQAKRMEQFSASSDGKLTFIKSTANLNSFLIARKKDPTLVAGILGLEGIHALEGDINNMDIFYAAGFRMMSPTHFFDNEMGGSAHGTSKAGLTDFGRTVIKEMETRHIVVDLAHASPKMIDDILAISTRPMVVSHTGVQGVVNSPRNLSDEHLKQIAAKGGLVGIGFWSTAVGESTPAAVAKSIRYTADLIGVEHVALGSDNDGTVTAPFDVSGMARITDALLKEGFTEPEIQLIMGENTIKFFSENLPAQ